MADVFSKAKRRRIMAAVRSKHTMPERWVARILRSVGIRFRRHPRNLPGQPDFLLVDQRVVVFVHGCFWHGHAVCRKGTTRPVSNRLFWNEKIEKNRRRDRRTAAHLRGAGFSVLTIWECEISADRLCRRLVKRLGRRRVLPKSGQA